MRMSPSACLGPSSRRSRFESTTGPADLRELAGDLLVLFLYPHATGQPEPPVPDWDRIPGTRGSTAQSCSLGAQGSRTHRSVSRYRTPPPPRPDRPRGSATPGSRLGVPPLDRPRGRPEAPRQHPRSLLVEPSVEPYGDPMAEMREGTSASGPSEHGPGPGLAACRHLGHR